MFNPWQSSYTEEYEYPAGYRPENTDTFIDFEEDTTSLNSSYTFSHPFVGDNNENQFSVSNLNSGNDINVFSDRSNILVKEDKDKDEQQVDSSVNLSSCEQLIIHLKAITVNDIISTKSELRKDLKLLMTKLQDIQSQLLVFSDQEQQILLRQGLLNIGFADTKTLTDKCFKGLRDAYMKRFEIVKLINTKNNRELSKSDVDILTSNQIKIRACMEAMLKFAKPATTPPSPAISSQSQQQQQQIVSSSSHAAAQQKTTAIVSTKSEKKDTKVDTIDNNISSINNNNKTTFKDLLSFSSLSVNVPSSDTGLNGNNIISNNSQPQL